MWKRSQNTYDITLNLPWYWDWDLLCCFVSPVHLCDTVHYAALYSVRINRLSVLRCSKVLRWCKFLWNSYLNFNRWYLSVLRVIQLIHQLQSHVWDESCRQINCSEEDILHGYAVLPIQMYCNTRIKVASCSFGKLTTGVPLTSETRR